MDAQTLLAVVDFSRARLLGTLDLIAAAGHPDAFAWRPAPGRAHIAWQAIHCAATLDKYLNGYLRGGAPIDPVTVERYGGGSVPKDAVPPVAEIRAALDARFDDYRTFVAGLSPADLEQTVITGSKQRTVGEAVVLLAWHEAHHQGQIHLTWNMFKAAHALT